MLPENRAGGEAIYSRCSCWMDVMAGMNVDRQTGGMGRVGSSCQHRPRWCCSICEAQWSAKSFGYAPELKSDTFGAQLSALYATRIAQLFPIRVPSASFGASFFRSTCWNRAHVIDAQSSCEKAALAHPDPVDERRNALGQRGNAAARLDEGFRNCVNLHIAVEVELTEKERPCSS